MYPCQKKLFVLVLLLTSLSVCHAVELDFGKLYGSWDTTLSYGLSFRVQNEDQRLICAANGGDPSGLGSTNSCNTDDGNLNYDKGLFSNTVKATSEIGLSYDNYGAFVRGTAFYDVENEDGSRERTRLRRAAKDEVGSDIRLLDAYVYGGWDVGKFPLDIRAGNQVLSWGESTFIQNSINIINPVNVSALRVPGAELREALLPVPLLSARLGITDNFSAEVFYQVKWEETEIDPPGSYFSTNDFVGDSGERVLLGFGAVPDTVPFGSGAVVRRSRTDTASDGGQFGVALRYFAPWLFETEFGFYYINYHSRVPIVSARTGTAAAAAAGAAAGNNIAYVQSSSYFTEYPEDINLYGFSFNTQLGTSGIALQGEVSHRRGVPLQLDDLEILFGALGAFDSISPGNTPAAPLANFGQLGRFGFEEDVNGFIQRDVTQVQMTATKVLGPTFGASTAVVVGELGVTHVHNLPSQSEFRLEAPGTGISGNAALAGFHFGVSEPRGRFADATSWGYRLATRFDYNGAIGPVNLSPRVQWLHDVGGNSPGPGGNFIEGRKAVTLGVRGTYLENWEADLSYTNFFGGGKQNLINDRDFIAITLGYSF